MEIEFLYTAQAAAALRKNRITQHFSTPQHALPATGDFVEIAGANGRLVLRVVARAFVFQPGAHDLQRIRLVLDLHRDRTPGLQGVGCES